MKIGLGWEVARVIVTRNEHIVAGAQMLIRPLPLVGAAAYVPKGPVCAEDHLGLARLVLRELHRLARICRVRYLAVQPPNDGYPLACKLPAWGFCRTAIDAAPTATVLLDLEQDQTTILAAMNHHARYNIGLGLRHGVIVKEGTERELPTFCRLLEATGRRQGFLPEREAYIAQMYRILAPRGWIRLFIAEYQGEAVSAALVVCFGETVVYKRGAWSGRHGKHRPNDVLQWEVIRWSKKQGYRVYDFEGIEPPCATAIQRGEPLPKALCDGVSSFKLGFGGQVAFFPGVYDYVYNPLLRRVRRSVYSALESSALVGKMMNRIRVMPRRA